jgi:hypothetical protein
MIEVPPGEAAPKTRVPVPLYVGTRKKELHVSIAAKTRNYLIVDDLTAPPTKPAGSGAPNPGARILVPTAETWPVGPLPANGKSFGLWGNPLSCPKRKVNGVSALNDLYIEVVKIPALRPSRRAGRTPRAYSKENLFLHTLGITRQ